MNLIDAAARLRDAFRGFPERAPIGPVEYILNPLDYAWENHETWLRRAAPPGRRVEAVFLGMNPGPFGMAQTGIPFGTPDMVREFLHMAGPVRQPSRFHPRRPVDGVLSIRSEVSGQRIWGAVRACFGSPEPFFERFFIANYCPLVFQSASGANLTPDKLPKPLWAECDRACVEHLLEVVRILQPQTVIGIGKWAEDQARRALERSGLEVKVGTILHPSPASPAANRGWRALALSQLEALGHPWPPPRGLEA